MLFLKLSIILLLVCIYLDFLTVFTGKKMLTHSNVHDPSPSLFVGCYNNLAKLLKSFVLFYSLKFDKYTDNI